MQNLARAAATLAAWGCLLNFAEAAPGVTALAPGESVMLNDVAGSEILVEIAPSPEHFSVVRIVRRGIPIRVEMDGLTFSHPVSGHSADYVVIKPGDRAELNIVVAARKRPGAKISLTQSRLSIAKLPTLAALSAFREATQQWPATDPSTRTRALDHFRLAARLSARVDSALARQLHADAWHAAGEVAFMLEDPAATVASYVNAVHAYDEQEQPIDAAVALNSLAQWHTSRRDFDAAELALEGATRRLDDSPDAIASLNVDTNRCLLELARREVAAAQKCFKETSRLANEIGYDEITLLSNDALGGVYSSRGDTQLALESFLSVLEAHEKAGDAVSEARTHSNIALQYRRLGYIDKALGHYQQALAVQEKLRLTKPAALSLYNIGFAYFSIGDYDRARQFLQQSRNLSLRIGDAAQADEGLLHLARIDLANDQTDLALSQLEQVHKSATQRNDADLAYRTLLTEADVRLTVKDPAGAVAAIDAAALLGDGFDRNPIGQGMQLMIRARAVAQLGEHEEALVFAERAVEQMKAAAYPTGMALSYELASEMALLQDDLTNAQTLIENALRIVAGVRGRMAKVDLRQQFGTQQFRAYDLASEIQLRHATRSQNPEFAHKGFMIADHGRAQSLTEVLAGRPSTTGADTVVIRRRQTLVNQLSQAAGSTPESTPNIARVLFELDTIDAELQKALPRGAILQADIEFSVQDIQTSLQPHERLLHFQINDWRSGVFVIGPDSFEVIRLGDTNELQIAVRELVQRIKNVQPLEPLLTEVSDALLTPLWPYIKQATRLHVVADGALHYLPLEALKSPAGNLLQTHTVSYLPASSVLVFLRQNGAEDTLPIEPKIAVMADPVFNRDDRRLPTPKLSSVADAGTEPRLQRTRLNRLTLSAAEANNIEALVDAKTVSVSAGIEASRQHLLNSDWRHVDVLHLATHGSVNAERPELSGLSLSRFDDKATPITGFVSLTDIYGLRLNHALVVLSACETALGRHIDGEGIIGMSRAFMYAGADRVISSLWRVEDRSTAELMAHFYNAVLIEGASPADALRQARLALQENPRWRHPYYWAGFALQGI